MGSCKYRRTGSSSFACDGDSIHFSSVFAADELEIAEILVYLPSLVKKSEFSRRFPASWGAKRKRSVLKSMESDSPAAAPAVSFAAGKLEDASTSPISPLAFPSPPPDFDSKLLRPKNKVSAAHQGELLEQCERLTDVKEMLKKEFKIVEAYRDGLMAENTILKQRMLQVHQHKKDEQGSLAPPLTQSQPLVASAPHLHNQQQPLIVFPCQEVGPSGIPDLNVSPAVYGGGSEYSQPLDLEYYHQWAAKAESRAAAAWARRNRSLIQKAKNPQKTTRGCR